MLQNVEVVPRDTVVLRPDGSYKFSGTGALLVTEHPPALEASFTLAVRFSQVAGSNGCTLPLGVVVWVDGWRFLSSFFFFFFSFPFFTLSSPDLIAKTNANGDVRYFAIYSSTTSQRITFYYAPEGSGTTEAASFPNIQVGDGSEHELILSVTNGVASLYIDGSEEGSLLLSGSNGLADCGEPGPDCYLNVGQRRSPSGGALRLRGTIFEALVYPLIARQPSP